MIVENHISSRRMLSTRRDGGEMHSPAFILGFFLGDLSFAA